MLLIGQLHACTHLPGHPAAWPGSGQVLVHEQALGSRDETISYLMPRRHGLEFGLYP